MNRFSSGEHVFTCYNIVPKQGTGGDKFLNIILDVPFTPELNGELDLFLWKNVKMVIQEASGKYMNEIDVYVVNIIPRDYKEGPRIRIPLRLPFEEKLFLQLGKLIFKDVKVEWTMIQGELFEEDEEIDDNE